MESIVAFFEKLVVERPWKRLVLISGFILAAICGFIAYERYTGHFQSLRLERGKDLLVAISTKEIRENVRGDSDLEHAHYLLKQQLVAYLEQGPASLALPNWPLNALAALLPWIVFAVIVRFSSTPIVGFGSMLGGMAIFAIPIVGIGAALPYYTFFFNYIVYPWLMFLLSIAAVLIWQKSRQQIVKPAETVQVNTTTQTESQST